MVYPILCAGFLLGLDSLAVSFAVGLTPGRGGRRWLPLAFALCDGLGSWAGAALDLNLRALTGAGWLGPAAVAGYGLYVLASARTAARPTTDGAWLVLVLPVCLSLDNLVAGPSLPFAVTPLSAVVIGGVSGALALVGSAIGGAGTTWTGRRAGWLSGAILLVLAAALVGRDALS